MLQIFSDEPYYRALSNAYLADAAFAQERAAFYYSWEPPVIFPVVPVYYVPAYYPAPLYGTTFFWGW